MNGWCYNFAYFTLLTCSTGSNWLGCYKGRLVWFAKFPVLFFVNDFTLSLVFSDPYSRSVMLSRMFFPFWFCICICWLGFESICLLVLHISLCICYGKSCKIGLAGFVFFSVCNSLTTAVCFF